MIGGMGEVYLCFDLETQAPYALKTFQQRYLLNPQLRTAFEHEVATWIALEKHPNIVHCFTMKIFDQQPFMVLEWITGDEHRGTDLRSWLQHGPLTFRQILNFTIDICRGLLHAQHKQPGIVHCDLKPDNILIEQGGVAKITDFGLAKIVLKAELEIPHVGNETKGLHNLFGKCGIAGTPPYMAPEQWRGEPLDVHTDIYAIGCVLYEMLTGEWAFQADTLIGFRKRHLEAEVPILTNGSHIPHRLKMLLERCLAKHPEERFATVNNLLQELTAIYHHTFDEFPKPLSFRKQFSEIDFNNRGSTYARLQCYKEALADFNRALELHPQYAIAYSNRGNIYFQIEQYEEALRDYAHALAIDPADALTYAHRGDTYWKLHRNKEALEDYNQAIELAPGDATHYYHRGTIYSDLQHFDQALADYNRALALDSDYAEAYHEIGIILSLQGKFHEALLYFERAARFGLLEGMKHAAQMRKKLAP